MKGVGAEHQMLMSATPICECKHSNLYVSLISARPCRATPFKKRRLLRARGTQFIFHEGTLKHGKFFLR